MAVEVKELKEKFETLQKIVQSEKENSIRLESEIKTLSNDYNEQLANILTLTGTTSLEEAKEAFKKRSEALESAMGSLSSELNGYLDTYGAEGAEGATKGEGSFGL